MDKETYVPIIHRVPNELLVNIFQAAAPTGSHREAVTARDSVWISHVSRRFRAIAIDTPELWSVVSNVQSKGLRALCLSRSKRLDLRILLLFLDKGTDKYTEFLEDIIPLKERWKEFHFRTGRCLTDYICIIQKLSELCSGLVLPRLTSLTLIYPDPTHYDTDGDGLDDYFSYEPTAFEFHFYGTWHTPQLKHVRARNIIPLGTGGSMMETCEIKLRNYCGGEWSPEALKSLSQAWTNLRALTFDTGDLIMDVDLLPRDIFEFLRLPRLETLTLRLQIMDLTQFMDAFVVPEPREMELHVLTSSISRSIEDDRDKLGVLVRMLLPPHKKYQSIRAFSLRFGKLESRRYTISSSTQGISSSAPISDVFDTIVGRLPNLHHLKLDFPDLPRNMTHNAPMPSLRTLTLRNCEDITAHTVVPIIDSLRNGAEWGAFSILTLDNCAKLEESELGGVMSDEKVSWVSAALHEDPEGSDSEQEYEWIETGGHGSGGDFDELYSVP